ncbi:MAG TPA: NAD-dependent protein deacylase [Fervidobacterium sp.]|nr:NAD-dependent protein deacylase [Fervidobacterium sp.]HOK88293.1 NAD-dependent protein deacylase [Fervidobacterium sp.]HOM74699.1 NAD-dependent protein deacylase [Fervidobacterium sp.]HRD20562.1 NAD-dependent protein deacylase [Fervidobacterium sp.]
MNDKIREFAQTLNDSKSVAVLTGAGVSVPSGIPDFRSPNGLYSRYGQEIFDIDFFNSNPEKFYEFAREGLFEMLDSQPNIVHKFLVQLERAGVVKGVVTQNIDGLHTKAGSVNVAEIHGTVRTWHCIKCMKRYEILDEQQKELLISRNFRCTCGGLTKPDIVFFGEMLPMEEYRKAELWSSECDTFIAMGTSLLVYPAAQLPVYALRKGAKLLIVNKGHTGLDEYAYLKIDMDLEEFVRQITTYLA